MAHTVGVNGKSNSSDHRLDITNFQSYYDCIRNNDLDKVKAYIENEPNQDKNTLINGYFHYGVTSTTLKKKNTNSYLSRPLHIAVAMGSDVISRYFLDNGADVLSRDRYGNTLFHSVAAAAHASKQHESRALEIYDWLIDLLGIDTACKLLNTENDMCFRPVEYAARLGTLRLLHKILHTKQAYVTREEIKGSTLYRWHDVTDYERGDRASRSPLVFLPNLHRSRLQDPDTEMLLGSQLFKTWTRAKLQCNMCPIAIWMLMRLAYFVAFFMLYADTTYYSELLDQKQQMLNVSASTAIDGMICEGLDIQLNAHLSDALRYFLIIASSTAIIFDVFDFFWARYIGYRHNIRRSNDAIVDHWFFRVCQGCANVLILTIIPAMFKGMNNMPNEYIYYTVFFRIAMPLLCTWSMLYFAQLLPSIGVAVNSIQSMLRDMVHFTFLYAMFLIPFQQVFQSYMTLYSKTGCQADFKDVGTSAFTITLMMFNIVDPREYDVEHIDVFRMLFVLYTFMCAIILLNFLIALMSNTAGKSSKENFIILQLNRLGVSCLVEMRLYRVLHLFYSCMRTLFFKTDSEGRVFIITERDRFESKTPEYESRAAAKSVLQITVL